MWQREKRKEMKWKEKYNRYIIVLYDIRSRFMNRNEHNYPYSNSLVHKSMDTGTTREKRKKKLGKYHEKFEEHKGKWRERKYFYCNVYDVCVFGFFSSFFFWNKKVISNFNAFVQFKEVEKHTRNSFDDWLFIFLWLTFLKLWTKNYFKFLYKKSSHSHLF